MRKTLATGLLLLCFTANAQAANFTTTPPERVTSSQAPFVFSWQSTGTGGSSAVAWKRSDEPYWHRCVTPNAQTLRFDSLPQGVFTLEIADDVNVNYYAAMGQLYSGITQPCRDDPPQPPASAISRFVLTVDDTPSAAPVPPSTPTPQPVAPAPTQTVAVTTPTPAPKPRESDCSRSRRLVLLTHAKTVTAKKAYKRKATKNRKAAYKKAQRVELAARRLRNLDCS